MSWPITVICLVVLFAVFYFLFNKNNSVRKKEMKKYSTEKELVYMEDSVADFYDEYEFYGLPNAYAGILNNDNDCKFLYAEDERTSLYAIKKSNMSIPEFYLCIENYDDNLFMSMGFEDIDYDEDKEFSDTFYLRSPKRETIDRLFVDTVRKSCLDSFNTKGYKIFAKNDIIVLTVTPRSDLKNITKFNAKLKSFMDVVESRLSAMEAEQSDISSGD